MHINGLVKAISQFLGVSMFLFGMLKFIDPFKSWYVTQVTASQLPAQELSYWAGQLGEISTGIFFLLLVNFSARFSNRTHQSGMIIGSIAVIAMMMVAMYVHLHPDVPAEVLPLKIKPPVIPAFFLVAAFLNMLLYKRNK